MKLKTLLFGVDKILSTNFVKIYIYIFIFFWRVNKKSSGIVCLHPSFRVCARYASPGGNIYLWVRREYKYMYNYFAVHYGIAGNLCINFKPELHYSSWLKKSIIYCTFQFWCHCYTCSASTLDNKLLLFISVPIRHSVGHSNEIKVH